MPVREEIIDLRDEILNRLGNDPEGFTRDLNVLPEQYRNGQARHQGLANDLQEHDAWDSYVYVNEANKDVLIIVQYLAQHRRGRQNISLNGENGAVYKFDLSLCIYDLGRPPRDVRRQVVYANLLQGLHGNIPRVIKCPERDWVGDEQVGHIVDFPIPAAEKPLTWMPEQNREDLLAAVTAGVEALLSICRCYVEKRGDLFMPPPR